MYTHLPSMIHPISYENSYSFIETTRLNLNLHAPFMNWSKLQRSKKKSRTAQNNNDEFYSFFSMDL